MIIEMVETLRRWESHCMSCPACQAYDAGPPALQTDAAPCGIGRAIILQLIHVLQRGL